MIWGLVADHVWQATLFSAIAFGAAALLGRGPARARYCVWLMASAKLAVPSFALIALASAAGLAPTQIASLVAPQHRLTGALTPALERVAAPFAATHGTGPAAGSTHRRRAVQPAALIWLAWVAGFLVVAGRWWAGRRRVSRAMLSGTALCAGREHEALERARARVGADRPTRLVVSREVGQPGVCGVLRPVVLLPEGVADRLSEAELELVFLHELVHVRRRDNLIANLHMALCCLFWFYPVVWLLDRRLLEERERVCDDEVLGLAGSPHVYASSLLKVFRFSLGPQVAGVSGAAGAALRERVARIAARRSGGVPVVAQRALVAATGGALMLFLAGGALALDATDATQPSTPTPAAHGSEAWHSRVPPQRVEAATAEPIEIENVAGAPVLIRAATVRIVALDPRPSARSEHDPEELVTAPTLRLDNATDRRVVFVSVELESASRWHDVVGFDVAIEAHGSYVLQPDWRSWSNIVPAGQEGRLASRIVEVRFEDGGRWGARSDDYRAAAVAPAEPLRSYPARFENPPGAPVVVVEATTSASSPAAGVSSLPVVTLANTTERRVTHLKLRFKAGTPAHAVTAFAAAIPPHGAYVFRSGSVLDGDADRMHVQLLGVRFEGGDVWGAFDTTIDTRAPTVSVPEYIHRPDR